MVTIAGGHPIVHFVGSIPLPDADTVFRTLASAAGPHLLRLPDGETGIRKTWIRFLQQVLAENPAIEVAADVPAFRFTQWDGKLLREIPRLRIKPGAAVDPATFETGYADMAIGSWRLFERLQRDGMIPARVKFQVSLPTPIAPTYNNMLPADRPKLLPALTRHLVGEVERLAAAIPSDRLAVQWDVCQEVLAWEGYYEPGPVDFHDETIAILTRIGDAVPAAVVRGVRRPIQFFHLPAPKDRCDDGYFAPLAGLRLPSGTALYLGLVHRDDAAGDIARLAAARRHARVDGIATECGMARGDPARFAALLAAHTRLAEAAIGA